MAWMVITLILGQAVSQGVTSQRQTVQTPCLPCTNCVFTLNGLISRIMKDLDLWEKDLDKAILANEAYGNLTAQELHSDIPEDTVKFFQHGQESQRNEEVQKRCPDIGEIFEKDHETVQKFAIYIEFFDLNENKWSLIDTLDANKESAFNLLCDIGRYLNLSNDHSVPRFLNRSILREGHVFENLFKKRRKYAHTVFKIANKKVEQFKNDYKVVLTKSKRSSEDETYCDINKYDGMSTIIAVIISIVASVFVLGLLAYIIFSHKKENKVEQTNLDEPDTSEIQPGPVEVSKERIVVSKDNSLSSSSASHGKSSGISSTIGSFFGSAYSFFGVGGSGGGGSSYQYPASEV